MLYLLCSITREVLYCHEILSFIYGFIFIILSASLPTSLYSFFSSPQLVPHLVGIRSELIRVCVFVYPRATKGLLGDLGKGGLWDLMRV